MKPQRYSAQWFMSSVSDLAGRLFAVPVVDSLLEERAEAMHPELIRIVDVLKSGGEFVHLLVERHRLLDAARTRVIPLEALEVVLELLDRLDTVLADADADSAIGINHTRGTARTHHRPIAGLTTEVSAA